MFYEGRIDTFISIFHSTSKVIMDFPTVNEQIKSVVY